MSIHTRIAAVLLFAPFAPMTAMGANSICAQNHIHSLKFDEDVWIFKKGVDYCDPIMAFPPELNTWIEVLGSVHRAAADLIEHDPNQLFGNGIDVVVQPHPMGELVSGAGKTEISVGVLPNWTGQPSGRRIYAHEIGHVVMSILEDRTASFKVLSRLMGEGVADLFAYEIAGLGPEGSFISGDDSPVCFGSARRVDFTTTFDAPTSFFYDTYFLGQLDACCNTLNFSEWGPTLPAMCQTFKKVFEARRRDMDYPPELGTISFDPHRLAGTRFVDDHQLGWVLNNFFIELGTRVSSRPLQLLLKAVLEGARTDSLSQEISCSFRLNSSIRDSYKKLSFRKLLALVRSALDPELRPTFDVLFEKYKIEKALIWDDLGRIRQATWTFESKHRIESNQAICVAN